MKTKLGLRVFTVLMLFCSAVLAASNSTPNLRFGQVPTAAQWNSYFASKLDYIPGPVNTIPYWDGYGNILNSAISGDCTSVANILTCSTLNGISFTAASGASNVGFQQGGSGAVATTVANQLALTIDVSQFGAVGDGVTDDTTAIKAAITYCGTLLDTTLSSGLTLTLHGKGNFLISSTLTIPNKGSFNVDIDGTITVKSGSIGTGVPAIILNSQRSTIHIGLLDANRSSAGISITAADTHLTNTQIHHFYGYGLKTTGAGNSSVTDCTVQQWVQEDAEFGVDAEWTAIGLDVFGVDSKFTNSNFAWSGTPVVLEATASGNIFINDHFWMGRPNAIANGWPLPVDPTIIHNLADSPTFFIGCYFDNGHIDMDKPSMVIDGGFYINVANTVTLHDPYIRVYNTSGDASPYSMRIKGLSRATIGFLPGTGGSWTGDYTATNSATDNSILGETFEAFRRKVNIFPSVDSSNPVESFYKPQGTMTFNYLTNNSSPLTVVSASVTRTSNVATIVTALPHQLSTGSLASVVDTTDSSFNVTSVPVSVLDAFTFTYANAGTNKATTPDVTGTISYLGLIQSQYYTGFETGYKTRLFRVADASGNTKFLADDRGNFGVGAGAALATTATDGFLYLPEISGTPIGTPSAMSTRAPIVVDSTTNKLWLYAGSSWVDVPTSLSPSFTGGLTTDSLTVNGTNSTIANQSQIAGTNTYNVSAIAGQSIIPTLTGGAATTSMYGLQLGATFVPNAGATIGTVHGSINSPILNSSVTPTTFNSTSSRVQFGANALGGTIGTANVFVSMAPVFDAAATTAITNFNNYYSPDVSGTSGVVITNIKGFNSAITSGTGKWGYYEGGNANNAYAGNSRFGGTTAPVYPVDVTGDINSSAIYRLNAVPIIRATAPTIASGFGTSPSVVSSNGTATFKINVGTGGTATSGVITMPAATTGYNCTVTPAAAPQAAAEMFSVATSTTSITITNYTASTGVALAWPASAIIAVSCVGF